MDNSNTMTEEQGKLSVEWARLLRGLVTGDIDDDGTPDSPGFDSLQLGMVTTDMGVGGHVVPTCGNAMRGDDGILSTSGNTALSGCDATYPAIAMLDVSSDFQASAAELSCVLQPGIAGCGFEQPLEAALKAVTPSGSTLSFAYGDTGHGDGANAGFLRPDSLLIVIVVSDENDCSAADLDLFNQNSGTYTTNLGLRCFNHPAALHPAQRYVDGLLALRPDPSRLVFAAVTGVPPNLVASDYQTILDDAAMQEMIDTQQPSRLVTSCDTSDGPAYPPRRLIEVARDLQAAGAETALESICNPSYSGIVDRILAHAAAL